VVVYSIKDIENICGIKAHTLRVWEKRYGILIAKRTETNIRYYTEEDLKVALNISILYRKGMKISKLAKLSIDQLSVKVAEITEIDDSFEKNLDTLSISMLELDENKFTQILNKNIEQKGFDETLETVIYPLLEKINLMWVADSINEVHEIFVLNIIKHKLIVEIDKLPCEPKNSSKPKFMLYLPEKESQKLSLYYMYYFLKKEKFPVFYFGEEKNMLQLLKGAKNYKPDYIFTIINDSFSERAMKPYIDKILQEYSGKLIISGYQAVNQSLESNEQYEVLSSLEQVNDYIKSIKEILHN
jgi:DNA-binding transcriptional MerR regulator